MPGPFDAGIDGLDDPPSSGAPGTTPSPTKKMLLPPSTLKGALYKVTKNRVDKELVFQFNPSTLKRQGSAEWQWGQGPGAIFPVATFGRFGENTITLDLLFDAREQYYVKERGLRGVLAEVESFCLPSSSYWNPRMRTVPPPDRACLAIGTRFWFCQVTTWQATEEAFSPALEPTRAKVEMQLRLIDAGAHAVVAYVDKIIEFGNYYRTRGVSGSGNDLFTIILGAEGGTVAAIGKLGY